MNDRQIVSTAQSVLRGWLIDHFINQQLDKPEYLLLTASRGPSQRPVAEQWAWLRQKVGTIPEEIHKAEIDLMYAVAAGKFPDLLMMCRTTSVELLPFFDRGFVETLAAKIGRKLEIEFDPWAAENNNTEPGQRPINTAVMTPEKCANIRLRDLGPSSSDGLLVDGYRGTLWAPKAAVVSLLVECGVDPISLPSAWLVEATSAPAPENNDWRPYPPMEKLGPAPAFAQRLLRQDPKLANAWPRSWTEGQLQRAAQSKFVKLPAELRPLNSRKKRIDEISLDAVKRAVGLKG